MQDPIINRFCFTKLVINSPLTTKAQVKNDYGGQGKQSNYKAKKTHMDLQSTEGIVFNANFAEKRIDIYKTRITIMNGHFKLNLRMKTKH